MLSESSFRKDEKQPPWHFKFLPLKMKQFRVGIRWQELKTLLFQTTQRYFFSASKAEQGHGPCGPSGTQQAGAVKDVPPLPPAPDCRQRQGQETEESHKIFNPPKGASDGIQGPCFRRIKAQSEACIRNHMQQKNTKSILGEKKGKRNYLRFFLPDLKQEIY